MGNPLSPLSAEIFMDNLEQKIKEISVFKNFLFWYRYVDDVFAWFLGTRRQLDVFHKAINKIYKNIEFTIEVESDNSINFSDLSIIKIDNKISFGIFHKPSQTDMVIHNSSMHPYMHKLDAFRSYIHRLLNISLTPENYQKELSFIKQIAVNNGYEAGLKDKMVQNKLLKLALALVYPTSKNNFSQQQFHVLSYIGSASDNIHKHIRFKNHNISFKINNSLGKYIKYNKSTTLKKEKSSVYQLKCGSWDKIYIGQTGRAFKDRINDRSRSYRNGDGKSKYADHILDENHFFDDDFKILHVTNKGVRLNALESLEINKKKLDNVLLNDQLDLNSSPLLNLF